MSSLVVVVVVVAMVGMLRSPVITPVVTKSRAHTLREETSPRKISRKHRVHRASSKKTQESTPTVLLPMARLKTQKKERGAEEV